MKSPITVSANYLCNCWGLAAIGPSGAQAGLAIHKLAQRAGSVH